MIADRPDMLWVSFRVNKDIPNEAAFKAWLTAEHTNGTPVTVYYRLAAPTETPLGYEEIKTFYPYTQIYTTSIIQPALVGKIRILGAD